MYCPRCAAQNNDGSKFCRACGEDLARVAQAMMKRLPEDDKDRSKLEKALKNVFVGVGFLIVAIVIALLAPAPANWALCFSMLIAAFIPLSVGVADIVHVKYGRRLTSSAERTAVESATAEVNGLQASDTTRLVPPPSITESTTKHLEATVKSSSEEL